MRRVSWLLILLVLLKLSIGFAMPMLHDGVTDTRTSTLAVHALPACHEHTSQASADMARTTAHESGQADDSANPSANPSGLDDCHQCCAVGLGMYWPTLVHALPGAVPMRAWTHGESLSPRPGLRPPIT
jgi:hypothetical protein